MNFYAFIALINLITSLILGIFVIYKNRNIKSISFSIFCFFIAFWNLGYYFWQVSTNAGVALFWTRVLMAGAIFIPVAYLQFVFALLDILNKKKKFLFYSYSLFFIFFLVNFTSHFVSHTEPLLGFAFWPIPGPVFVFFLAFWLFYAYYSISLLLRYYKRGDGVLKLQIKYIMFGTILGYIGGVTNFFLWYRIPILPFGHIAISLYALIVAYAILKYRLMDIRVIIGRIAVYALSFIITLSLAFLIMFVNEQLTRSLPLYFSGSVIVIISVLTFQFIFKFFEKLASKYFYYTFYSYQKVINNLGRKIVAVLDLEKLNTLIIETLINTLKLDKTGILLRDKETGFFKIQRIIGFKEENGISLVKDNFLTDYLEKTNKPLVYEELGLAIRDAGNKGEKENLKNLQENMKRIEAGLCLPLLKGNEIMGLIILGKKISGDSYYEQDIELLNTLSNQASVALENARLYREIQDLSAHLQQKVDEQTKEIKQAYNIEKKANEELKRLDEAKTQFMLATQHHLRTPLTSMIGYIDLLLTGTFGNIPKKIKDVLFKFQSSTSRLGRTVNEFLDISQFQLGREVITLEPNVDILPILKEMEEEIGFEAKNKGIYFKVKKSKIPLITADANKLKIAFFNIADNAIKYTPKGGVNIETKTIDDKIQIIFKDTGMGLNEEDKEKLFSRLFERGAQAQKVFATGRGIGLYLSSQIIKAHGGKLWADSEGRGKGSTFYIELPLK